MTEQPERPDSEHSWHEDTPFPRRWIGYVALKVAIIVIAVAAALWWYGLV